MIPIAVELWNERRPQEPGDARSPHAALHPRRGLRLTNVARQQKRAGGNPGPEGSIGKLANAELNQAIGELCVDLMGPEGMLHDDATR